MVQLKSVGNPCRRVFSLIYVEFLESVDGDVSLQCEKGDVDTFFTATNASTIRAQDGKSSFFLSVEILSRLV